MNYSKSHIEYVECNNDECIKCESDGINEYCMGIPLKNLNSNHFDNDRFKNFNIPIGLFVFPYSQTSFDFDKLNNFNDKIDIEELEIDSDLDEEDNDYYSETNKTIDPFLIDDSIENNFIPLIELKNIEKDIQSKDEIPIFKIKTRKHYTPSNNRKTKKLKKTTIIKDSE